MCWLLSVPTKMRKSPTNNDHADPSSDPAGPEVFSLCLNLLQYFVYALASLCICADSLRHSWLDNAKSTKGSCADSKTLGPCTVYWGHDTRVASITRSVMVLNCCICFKRMYNNTEQLYCIVFTPLYRIIHYYNLIS